MQEIRILFLCRGNRCRSPLAEALAGGLPRRDCRLVARSAGLTPKSINGLIPEVLAEIGVEPPGLRSKHVREFRDEYFDFVITLCGEIDEDCPVLRGGRNLSFCLPDPCRPKAGPARGTERERFRRVRDALRAMLTAWFGPER
jgi:arsenate reductase